MISIRLPDTSRKGCITGRELRLRVLRFTVFLGFKGIRDGTGYHIGYKRSSQVHSILTIQNLISNYPVDITAGTQSMFIYLDIIHYQIVGDTKAPLLRVIDTNRRVKNGNVCPIEPNHRKVFSNLDYKKLLVNSIQSIGVNLRTETCRLVPFASGGGKVVLTLKIQKFQCWYYIWMRITIIRRLCRTSQGTTDNEAVALVPWQ